MHKRRRLGLVAVLLKKAGAFNTVWNEDRPGRRKVIAACLFAVSLALTLWQARNALRYGWKTVRGLLA